ncbi:nitroreductase [Janthinobacterium sp. PC23-8]|uniref:nitroreductase n=1 Tax=Janthinobacterium sp. PC23-8 TaxID=2012679 RepID=UPI000B9604C7|nr:nitroreductase [Janthinobacterium sp. PC23-8]OYO26742.1 nitroreductase [Janthinobacterium sp. PC23-8]
MTHRPSSPTSLLTFEAVLDARYSCRGYLDRPVERGTIEAILGLAQRTPSWCNSQPWQVIVTGATATERLRQALQLEQAEASSDIAPPLEYRGVYRERRRECGKQLYDSLGIAADDRASSMRQTMENFKFFGAPHMALITTEALLGTYGAVDCGAYVNNFMLAARSVGVASIAQAAIAMRSPFLHQWFEIPEDRQIVCGISFGYEDPAHPANRFRTTRATLEQSVRWVDA